MTSNADHHRFETVALDLAKQLGGTWSLRLNGPDQRYWDLVLDGSVRLTLHLEHHLGIFLLSDTVLDPACGGVLERAAAAISTQAEWTCEISFDGLFCPGDDADERLSLARGLTPLNDHIHGRLEIRVAGRALPRLGFWGPDDVCLKSWLEELARALTALDAAENASYAYDEGEQGQPAFVFERESTLLMVSVRDSPLSEAAGEEDWTRVSCDYEDFRFQVLRFRGLVRATLEAELGAERADAWLSTVAL